MTDLHLIKSPCPYCSSTGDDCACREFMAMLSTMTPEEKQRLDAFMHELRREDAPHEYSDGRDATPDADEPDEEEEPEETDADEEGWI